MRSPFHFQFRVTGASVPASGKGYKKQKRWILGSGRLDQLAQLLLG
jgi:hypothetical protein